MPNPRKSSDPSTTPRKKPKPVAKTRTPLINPSEGRQSLETVVGGCLANQVAPQAIAPDSSLGALAVDGATLAGCLNGVLGTAFRGQNFPPTMTVRECVLFVYKAVERARFRAHSALFAMTGVRRVAARTARRLATRRQSTDDVTFGCIGAGTDHRVIHEEDLLSTLGVDGGDLAGCVNSKLGTTKFKASNFPGANSVADCILYVRNNYP